MAETYERVLLVKNEVFVFRIPPLTTTGGYKAADWDLQNPNWVGRLRLVAVEEKLEIRLEDKNTGNLYAKAPIAGIGGADFEQVSDSSRYFVIRLKNDGGQTAFVGIGFADRSDSFDLNVAVQDHFKMAEKEAEIEKEEASRPKLDLSFKEGQTITVNLGKKTTSTISDRPKPPTSVNMFPVLRPVVMSDITESRQPMPAAIKRLTLDYRHLIEDPLPSIVAHPLPENILEWHYLILGSEDTPFAGGYYHGKLVFPHNFPMAPPAIYMITPSGRFVPNIKVCLSISDFHPETWNPAWTVSSILLGIMSFMNDTHSETHGSMETTDDAKRDFAKASIDFNLKDPVFCRIFSDFVEMFKEIDEDEEDDNISEEENI
ncbi:hypothetical protein FO519_005532 [Halicephalobus sp. NKZ332]|nr:hypothetical protein FO519_005532 [Halicephalobus sp. NKZ332]